ncbi:MAG: N-acetylornithine carbamoyltransferase [Planctomycetota bacterium]
MTATPHRGTLVRLGDLPDERLEDVLELARRYRAGARRRELEDRSVGLLFFRHSLRTRTSFEVALNRLGGHAVQLSVGSDFWELEARSGGVMDGTAPEHVRDAAAVLSSYVDAIAIRPALKGQSWEVDRRDEGIRAWAEHARVPVINMESALWHPLQGLADLMTLRDALGDLPGRELAVVWTPSPDAQGPAVVHTVLQAAVRFGMRVRVAHPPGYELDPGVLDEVRATGANQGGSVEFVRDARDAVAGAHVVYARSWSALSSYGQPTLAANRVASARGWLVDEALMRLGEDARLMHPMPVRRNLEVTDEVLDGPRSLLYRQAENRLHTQMGLLSLLLRD